MLGEVFKIPVLLNKRCAPKHVCNCDWLFAVVVSASSARIGSYKCWRYCARIFQLGWPSIGVTVPCSKCTRVGWTGKKMAENAASENTDGDVSGSHSHSSQEVKKRSKQLRQRNGPTDSRQYIWYMKSYTTQIYCFCRLFPIKKKFPLCLKHML